MQYRLQEDKEMFPTHLILTGPLTDANYDLIKNQLKKAEQKQRQFLIGDINTANLMMTNTQQLMNGTADGQILTFIISKNSLWFFRTAYGNYQENSSTERIIQIKEKKEEVPKKRLRKKECKFLLHWYNRHRNIPRTQSKRV